MANFRTLDSGSIRVTASVDGVPVYQTFTKRQYPELKLRTLAAQSWAAEVELKKQTGGAIVTSAKRRTLASWRSEWWPSHELTLGKRAADTQAREWRLRIEPHFGKWALSAITSKAISQWVAKMGRDDNGPHVVYAAVMALSSILSGALDAELIGAHPIRKRADGTPLVTLPPRPSGTRRAAADGEVDKILAELSGQWRTLFTMLAETGLRWSEVAGMPIWALDLAQGEARVTQVLERDLTVRPGDKRGKGRNTRRMPLSSHLCVELAELIEGRDPAELVFMTEASNPAMGRRPLTYANVYARVWTPACERAGVSLKIHELRHTAHTTWMQAGVPDRVLIQLGGWSSGAMLQRHYSHVRQSDLDAARAVRERP